MGSATTTVTVTATGTGPATAGPFFKGYAALSRYQDSDIDLGIIRRFGHLHFRNLLYYQDELAELEGHLERLDLRQDLQEKEHGSRRYDKNPARVGLMAQIRTKLQAFDEALLSTSEILRLQRPMAVQTQALGTFVTGTRPLVELEAAFITKQHDLVALHTPEEPYPKWVKRLLEYHSWSNAFETQVSRPTDTAHDDPLTSFQAQRDFFKGLKIDVDTNSLKVHFTSAKRVRLLMRIVVTFSGCLLLLVPIILLYLLQSDVAKLVIIVATVLLFATITAATTSAKNWEVVAAAIGYAAVLVVFVTSGVGQSPG
ncbi:hypothetical protein LTR85_008363 [Meristemomyces frigidus]|nr:hypothetical protein LTR85_008363 [Meristemomyces frigidus]